MDKLKAMKVFVKIAELGSLTEAAYADGKSLPSVVRMLAALENDLQVRLFNRTTRKIALTEEGHIYLEHCRKILSDIEDAERLISNDRSEPSGLVTLTAPVRFGEMYVSPIINQFLKQHPRMQVKLLLLDRIVNILDEGIDFSIRIAPLNDSSVYAKAVGNMRQVVCASPELVKTHGRPQHPEALTQLPCLQFIGIFAGTWTFYDKKQPVSVRINGPLICNQVQTSVDACVAGIGFGKFLSYQVLPLVHQGKLDIVLSEFEPETIAINLVYPHARLMAPRVRKLIDYLSSELQKSLAGLSHPATK